MLNSPLQHLTVSSISICAKRLKLFFLQPSIFVCITICTTMQSFVRMVFDFQQNCKNSDPVLQVHSYLSVKTLRAKKGLQAGGGVHC